MFNLIVKILWDKRLFIVGWSFGMAALAFLMIIFFPSFSGGEIDKLVESMPAAMQGFLGSLQDWRELPGYIGSQVFDIRLPIFVSILGILLAVGLSVGEEEKGHLRTLSSLPISRVRIAMGTWISIVLIALIATLATLGGVGAGLLGIGETLDPMVLIRLGFMTWLMISALASVIFAFGMATGKRGLTMAVGIIVAIGSFIVSTFSVAVDWLEPYDWLSIFHYFPATAIAKGTIEAADVLVYAALIVLSLVAILVFFPRRDIKG